MMENEMPETAHIASAFDRDLEAIQALVMKMGGMVEAAIENGARAFHDRDEELAQQVRKNDKEIDALEEQINREAARVIALRAPTASDLRIVLSVIKISSNLERVGDYAKNMGKRTTAIIGMEPGEEMSGSIRRMAREVRLMLNDVLDAFLKRDPELADAVRLRDADVDDLYNTCFRELITFMLQDTRNISPCMHMHFIAKNIERMGDHVTNIAEQIIYMSTGEMPEDGRPKGDKTSYEVIGID